MITIRRSGERGHANHGWLDTWHTFSFASYFDPDFMGFSELRVLNQDVVKPGRGFPSHGHSDMEIVTHVLNGVLEHRDSMGTGSKIRPGEVQLMSAGTGVTHSEFNASAAEPLELLQMWVLSARKGGKPRYEQREFPERERRGALRLVVSPDGRDGSLRIGQDARLLLGLLDGGETIRGPLGPERSAWLHVPRGELVLNGHALGPGDGAGIRDEPELFFERGRVAEIVLWDLPLEAR